MAISEMPLPSKNDWEAEGALRTLVEAEKIQQNENLMSRVEAEADKQAEGASRIARQYGNETTPSKRHPDRDRERTQF